MSSVCDSMAWHGRRVLVCVLLLAAKRKPDIGISYTCVMCIESNVYLNTATMGSADSGDA